MRIAFLSLFGAGFGMLAGCLAFHAMPIEGANIKLDRVDSPRVFIESATFGRDRCGLVLRGSVVRKVSVMDTTQTRLKITLFDKCGDVLRAISAEFEPRDIPRGPRMSGWSDYKVLLDPLPAATSRIEIRAYEKASGPPGS